MPKSFCRLLMEVNHAYVAIFNVAYMSFNAIRENKILAKISEFTVQNSQPYTYCINVDGEIPQNTDGWTRVYFVPVLLRRHRLYHQSFYDLTKWLEQ